MILIQAIGLWMLIGIVIWFLKIFVYFKGPRHTVDWILHINKKYSRNDPTIEAIRQNPGAFVVVGLIIYSIIGPFSIIDFINVMVDVSRHNKKK